MVVKQTPSWHHSLLLSLRNSSWQSVRSALYIFYRSPSSCVRIPSFLNVFYFFSPQWWCSIIGLGCLIALFVIPVNSKSHLWSYYFCCFCADVIAHCYLHTVWMLVMLIHITSKLFLTKLFPLESIDTPIYLFWVSSALCWNSGS